MAERKLAHVESIEEIRPIYLKETDEPAQNIVMYRVLGWWVVGKINEFNLGQKVIYIEIDSKIQSTHEYFAFLEQKKYKIKTMKLNKFYFGNKENTVISQGLIAPLNTAFYKYDDIYRSKPGDDVTDLLKITKIEDETRENQAPKKVDRSMAFYHKHHKFFSTRFGHWLKSKEWFRKLVKNLLVKTVKQKVWPFYITKTDEERIQNRPHVLETYKGKPMQVTEKLDGTSTTFGLHKLGKKKFEFAVCSRNVRQLDRKQMTWYKDAEANFYWEMADKYNVEHILVTLFDILGANEYVYLQGETVGPQIQSNKYALKERQFFAFNLVVDGNKVDSVDAKKILEHASNGAIKWVPILDDKFILPSSVDELVSYSNAKSVVHDTLREGVVIRDKENTVSFKVINPEFLIKWNL